MDQGIIALAAGIGVALAAGLAALAIGMAGSHAFDAMARQLEMAGKIQGLYMAAIVFIEACAIYALVVALLLLFVF